MSNIEKKDNGQDDIKSDARLDLMGSYVMKTMKLKAEKWSKMMNNDEYKQTVFTFFDTPQINTLLIFVSSNGLLTSAFEFPANPKSKITYFLRTAEVLLTKDNFRDVVLFGDVSNKPVDELAVLTEHVFIPMLSNPGNRSAWPGTVQQDINKHVAKLRNCIYEVQGAMNNQTLLPMPIGIERVVTIQTKLIESNNPTEDCDLELKSSIEGIVIKWASQINDVLNEESISSFANGANPGPMEEIHFWKSRLKNLESIYYQLRDSRVRKMASILEITRSVYYPCYKNLFRNIVEALSESREIVTYLQPVVKHYETFLQTDFFDCKPLIRPMMHCTCLVWGNCKYYCSNPRIVILLKQINNMVIAECSKSLEPSSILQGEPDEGHKKITDALGILEFHRQIFDGYRGNLQQFIKSEEFTPPMGWTFHPKVVFERFDVFVDRLKIIDHILKTAIEFFKLEKVEIAGVIGKLVGPKIMKVFQEFTVLFMNFGAIQYDPLVPEGKEFMNDYKVFQKSCDILDKRLAALFEQAWDDIITLEGMFKLVFILGSIPNRPIIKQQIGNKYLNLIVFFENEINTVKIMFDEGLNMYKIKGLQSLCWDKWFPPLSGALMWIRKIKWRICKPYENFENVELPILECQHARYVLEKYKEMISILDKFQQELIDIWIAESPQDIALYLPQNLIIRDDKKLLKMNFHSKLEAILREIKYLKKYEIENIPEVLEDLYNRKEDLQRSSWMIMRIVEWYNRLILQSNEVEFNLIADEMSAIDELLERPIKEMNWTEDYHEELQEVYDKINHLQDRVLRAQNSVKRFLENCRRWGDEPLFTRKDRRKNNLIGLDDHDEKLKQRKNEIGASGEEFQQLMNLNYKLFFNIPVTSEKDMIPTAKKRELTMKLLKESKRRSCSIVDDHQKGIVKSSEKEERIEEECIEERVVEGVSSLKDVDKYKDAKRSISKSTSTMTATPSVDTLQTAEPTENQRSQWLAYEDYMDGLVSAELINAIEVSTKSILCEMSGGTNMHPLFEITMKLLEPDIKFVPSIQLEDETGFYLCLENIISDIFNMCLTFPRGHTSRGQLDFKDDLAQNKTIIDMRVEILDKCKLGILKIHEFAQNMDKYSYLWLDDRQELLRQFLTYNHFLSQEELDIIEYDEDGVEPCSPTNDQFKKMIDFYNDLHKKTDEEITSQKVINGWLAIDVRPFKQAVLNTVCKWGNMFKQYLADHVVNSLNELESFIKGTTNGLKSEVADGDLEALLKIMSLIQGIKDRQIESDHMFEPLKDIMELLKLYNVEFEEEVYTQLLIQLAELPEKWDNCKKVGLLVKQKVAPLQANEVNLIRKRLTLFDLQQGIYKTDFRKLPFFKAGYHERNNVYKLIDETEIDLSKFEVDMSKISTSAELFELALPEFKQIRSARKELKLIKMLWDLFLIIYSTIEDWKTTPWKKINAEEMDQECKRYGKDLRLLDKEVRTWDPYLQIESELKNLMTSLRAVTELQNPAIRDRHWQELMLATKVKFMMAESTTLANLLALKLHEYEDEVKNIVDKSVKEMSMEKTLNDLSVIWGAMEFETEIHERTGIMLLRTSEELIETLEEHQVQLQNLMTSKFIGFFLEEVSGWQKKLSYADQVIAAWFEVQRKWMYLESIFIGSEDIRSQLPDDSKRFDEIDEVFKVLLEDMQHSLNVISGTNKSGLAEQLEQLISELVLCEKALNDYLETKRLAFPRFYFVSSADLLDILSTGNQPELVCRHLSKLYDNLSKLTFKKGTKTAEGMISKENNEYVEYTETCDCSGQVEVWLNRVTSCMRNTLHSLFCDAVLLYEEKPRDLWLFDWPAQVALCGTQIWWTTEVNIAFSRLEEGYENAMKDYQKKQITQLNALIVLLLGDLTQGDRQKIMTICTIDVHSRDVVAKMIVAKVDSFSAFQWQSQLRHRWDKTKDDCFANICDACFVYAYEYLGNTPRLVITPLTDRCYITLTQSLHLVMGGAPAGPAGTGKTETTKDLGRALGVMVYVFNCSEQMDYKSCGNIYKGLSQTGAWGCFDEFNRISVEVLSVIAVQVKVIQDAIKSKKNDFCFMGQKISLVPSVGLFITMNPGYAGRTELPENLKALFRPCAMVVPDFELICEIMLVAEGFQDARLLARKFITLYTLCKELLSNQDHYDWGLRAIKSVLVVAGSLKRSDRQRPEDQVLMRALRDFNIPKIVTDDVTVFMGLIGDLFPALDVPRKRDLEFEKLIKQSATELKLQPEDGFVLKVVQLEELFAVRHSVFVVGNAGTGKTMVWRSLNRTYVNQGRKPIYNDLNPKSVTNDELFGIINSSTREWRDGLFSVIMRDLANLTGNGPKWIVLDGDIDPMWIESLNTVMDDNKVLTLASNERIALTPHMRLLFEVSHLRTATPATVSRAGILYINPADLGWNPYVTSWIEGRENQTEKANLLMLFDKYIPLSLEQMKKLKKITPISETAQIQMLCHLLDCFLVPANVPMDCPKEWYEVYFVFSCVWAFGSALFQDQLCDWRCEFNKWWINEFKTVRFPVNGTVFDFYIELETKKFVPWTEMVPSFELDTDIPLQSTIVNTTETTRIRFFIRMLMEKRIPVMLVGSAGTGKTVLMQDQLSNMGDHYAIANVPFNFYTTAEMLQNVLEKPLEKKAGRNYGPPGNKSLIYFVDDMNMPEVDKFGTVQPHTLIRQYFDYNHWYDRTKLVLKDIHNCQYVSCMNPTAGSFTIDSRLQRHFCVFALSTLSFEASHRIYYEILSQHVDNPVTRFPQAISQMVNALVTAGLSLHTKMSTLFLPTAVKFHYTFNLRDLSNIFQGILFANGDAAQSPSVFIRLWMHEVTRVYGDKLVDSKDHEVFSKLLQEVVKKGFEEVDDSIIKELPLIYCHFAESIGDPKYLPVPSWSHLSKILNEGLASYNDLVGAMNLVLFEDAMCHICRISRILEAPRGNALLVGVGGSGKQSLSRVAAFISSLDVFQLQLRKGYSLIELRMDLAALYLKAGIKGIGTVFLMTDAQVDKEIFLVLINDMLASGEIPDLFSDDDYENTLSAMRNDVKQAGLIDTRENCWKFFIDKVRRVLKVVLCFSPVGSTLRIRARKFPALVNCTTINWFHEWPKEALESVSKRFLEELECLPKKLTESVALYMSYVHTSVNEMSESYLLNERRYNYTTPKSFLEQISLYSKLLTQTTIDLKDRILRLQNGLTKLAQCAQEVDGLKITLAAQEVNLKIKNDAADKLILVVGSESEKVATEKSFANAEEKKVRIIEEDVSIKARVCAEDLAKAEPALLAAQEALNTLNKNNLTELKSFGSPPDAVVNVCAAVSVLLSKGGRIPKDRSWKACKLLMGNVGQFLNDLVYYDKENIDADIIKALQPYLNDKEFNPDFIMSKSSAAAGLCAWVININKFNEVFVVVEPKRKALITANKDLANARAKLEKLKTQIATLEEKLSVLTSEFEEATNEKMKCQAEADATAYTIDLANRLVNGLASENIRWRQSVESLKVSGRTIPGDILLVSCFISYVGCFTRMYRQDLQDKYWLPYFTKLKPEIPRTSGLDPLTLLTDDAQVAVWNNEGLPSDRMSSENATILTNSARWPLMIDPQLQGIKWIKNKYGSDLQVIRLTGKNYLEAIERAVGNGDTMLIENIYESVDAVLNPLLGRALIKKGKCIKIGDKEMDYNPKFRLILQTRLGNPHYKPEMQAQTTLINFTVTRDGLEDQLLAEVVKAERPDLETLKSELTKQQNDFKITLKTLEDNLLSRLSSAGANVLEDATLVLNLEKTKKTAEEVAVKVDEAKVTGAKIDDAREYYRSCACRASILYFILNDLYKINMIYQFSLKAFSVVFKTAIAKTPQADTLEGRCNNLLDSITFSVYMYTSRGLFERDKLIFKAQVAIQILLNAQKIDQAELDFLLRFPVIANVTSPVDYLTNMLWAGIKMLSTLPEFTNLDRDIEGAAKRWKKFVECESPEKEKFPQEWKSKTALQRLCMMRCLRPDRMIYAMGNFIEEKLGAKFMLSRSVDFETSFAESSATTSMFFILSPGVTPLKDIEDYGKKLKISTDFQNFHVVSLGQGQEIVAEQAIDAASKKGEWVLLQNIHLVAKWLVSLEKKMEQTSSDCHPNYRLFISAEPASSPEYHILPQGILESSIKITNEAPTGMMANIHKALDNFTQETLELCTKETEFKSILFALCYFHAVVAERRKFGPQGWNRIYPFNMGDLTISVYVLHNYLENNTKTPWEDLRYLFGEIMYGGHITDDWDRRLCRTYLEEFMQPELVDGDLHLVPGFIAPGNMDYVAYHSYIDEYLPDESPYLYGLHPNAEIGFLTTKSEHMFRTIFELQPRDSAASGSSTMSKEEKVKFTLDEIVDKLPDEFNMFEIMSKVEERTPFIIVAFQECERMNTLAKEMRRSLKELDLGLKGELTITKEMEDLQESLFMDQVPVNWTKRAYPSMLGLAGWFNDLLMRFRELESWAADFQLPAAVWLAGFFNPQSFLTAIMQQTARKNEWPLDKMCLNCDVTKKQRDEFTVPPREGAFVHGLYMEGARWDIQNGTITDSRLKELFPIMPVIFIKAVTQDKQEIRNIYECPIYKTRKRQSYVWTFNLKTKAKPAKWTLAGVGLFLQV